MDIHESKFGVKNLSDEVAAHASGWVENFAKFGHYAKGVVYILIGGLTAFAAFGLGGKVTGARGTVQFILEQPFGRIMLGAVALGLFGYVLWRFYQAIKDPQNRGSDTKGIAKRIGYAWSGLIYGALAIYSAFLAYRGYDNGGSSGDKRQMFVSKVLSWDLGEWIIGIIAVGTILLGLYQIYRAISERYLKNINISSEHRDLFKKAGKVGYIARGIVWGVIGYMLLQAALHTSSGQAGSTESAFQFLRDSTYGPILMGIVALGLACYGIFMFIKGKYFRLPG